MTEPAETGPAPAPENPPATELPPGSSPRFDRQVVIRRLATIMLVRVVLYTLVLGGTVVLYFAWGTPEELGGPYVTVLFVFIALIYVLNIAYAVAMGYVNRLVPFALLQIVVDLLASAALVHFTGGADSAFVVFFLLSPIVAAITVSRRAALVVAAAAIFTLCAITTLGYAHWLPTLVGQDKLPWEMSGADLVRSLLLHGGAMLAVAVLAGYLADQLRTAAHRVQAQQAAIGDLAALNANIIRCLTSGLLTVDRRGDVLTLNAAAAEMLNVQHHEAIGAPLATLSAELATAVHETAPPARIEIPVTVNKDTRIFSVSTSPLTDHLNAVTGHIINFQDQTALRRLEQTIKRSEHLATIGRLAAGIAHEIRNPLASISGSLELLQSDSDRDGDDGKLMGIALREIERLDRLIVDLLEFARPKRTQLDRLHLSGELQQMVSSISGLLGGKRVPTIEITRCDSDLWIDGDRDQIRGLLWNLVRNAWQAGEEEHVSIALVANGDDIELTVSDGGAGIDTKELGQIFEPFFTTKAKGTGLGLAIVKRAVQDHGGTIRVESKREAGTRFTISLPRAAAPQ